MMKIKTWRIKMVFYPLKQDIFDVELIFGKKMEKLKIFYAVKWLGYSKKQMTWEPIANFSKQSFYLIQRFESNTSYQIYQKLFDPKKGTIKIHIKQRYQQIYIGIPQRQNRVNMVQNKLGYQGNQSKKGNYEGKEELKKQQFVIENLLNKETIKAKKFMNKLELKIDKQYSLPQVLQKEQIIEVKNAGKEKPFKIPQAQEFERSEFISLTEQFEIKLKVSENTSSQKSKVQSEKLRNQKSSEECQIIGQSKKIKENKKSGKEQIKGLQKDINQKKNERIEMQNDVFDLEICVSISDESQNRMITQGFQSSQNNIQTEQRSINPDNNSILANQPIPQTSTFQDLIEFPKFKLEREYLNEIIISQRKKEINQDGKKKLQVTKNSKDQRTQLIPREQNDGINLRQLEKNTIKQISRCRIPIIPKLLDNDAQVGENEFATFQIQLYDETIKLISVPYMIIESILSHHKFHNLILFKCIYENGKIYYLEFQSLQFVSPILLLDYMSVNSILI